MFHLMTHAFFKALLFLAAGAVSHHLGGEQDIRRMGGLRTVMPNVHRAFLVGCVSLAALPPFSGFWSKDGIISSAFADGGALGYTLFAAGLLGALLTGAYTFRLYYRVFHGAPSDLVTADAHADGHGHGEGPQTMLVPIGALAVLATIGGLVVIPGVWEPFLEWIDEVAPPLVEATTAEEYFTSLISVGLAVIGILLARRAFRAGRELVPDGGVRTVLEHKLYFDELYDALFSRPAQALALLLRDRVETPVVHRSIDEVARGSLEAGSGVARVQTGLLRTYALVIAASAVVLAVVFLAVR
jgi:NADH-quinone oxidoreductase subunit L